MRLAVTILAFISASLGLILTILPFGSIALIPIFAAFILGFIAYKMTRKENKNTKLIKVIFLITAVALALSIYRSVFETNEVENDIETIEKEKKSEEDAIKELEEIEIED